MLSESHKIVQLVSPAADYNAATVNSAYVSMKNHNLLTVIVAHKGGTTGKSTLTLSAASDTSGTGAAAIAFTYRRKTTGASDVYGAITAATTAGIDTVPAEDTLIELFVKSSDLPDGKPYVKLTLTEAVNDPVSGSAIAILGQQRYKGTSSSPSVLT
jgi:hypothetical protein